MKNLVCAVWLLLCLLGAGQLRVQAQTEAEFTLNNVTVTLAEVTPEADVYFRSLRLNRALNVWNVEVTVSNRAARVLSGPVVLLLDGFSGTTGVQAPDGTTTDGKGFLDLSAEAGDGALSPGEVTAPRTLTLGRSGTSSPTLATKVFAARPPVVAALGVTRSLDEAGRPLPGVALEITGPVGAAQQTSDAPSGVASFGQGPGEHLLKFSTDGYLPVWRKQTLAAERTTVLPNPRLTKRSPQTFSVTPLGGTTVSNATGTIAITFGAGAVSQSTTVTLTPLTGQNLPAFLPAGWSPLNAFWLESSSPVTGTLNALLRPVGPISPTETAALVRWNETGLHWLVVQTLAGQGTNAVTTLLPGTGAYALVVGDSAPLAPPAAQLGQALAASSAGAIDPAGLTATGQVTPPASPASVIPEFVTGTANLVLTHATANLPSGYLLRGEVTETYRLSDGSLRLTPQYEHFIVGYQRPGDQNPRTLHASFPMRPVLLFGTDQLEEATVRVDVLPEQPFDGQVLDEGGGQVGADGVRLLAGSGRLTGPSALRLRRLDATVFTNLVSEGQEVVAAFDLTVDGSTLTGTLGAQLTGAPADGLFVVARVLSDVGFYGLQPVERLQSDANGNLSSLEPSTGERLPGLRGSGQFVLVQVGAAQGLISGVARNGAGEVQANMPVRLTGLPWLTLTDGQGRFQLVAPVGEVEVGVTDPRTGDTGFVSVTIPDPQTPVGQDVATAPAGPRVAQITPADQAVRVPRVGSVVIRFNEAVNPATVLGAIQLLRPDDSIVTAALTLNLRNTIATLSPAVELDANTTYRVRLAGTIADPGGLPLEGQAEFSFTTVPLSTRVATAQLIIYEPGATNVPSAILDAIPAFTPGDDPFAIVVHGQPGVADPEVPVILVNESTGETQTVLSQVDGSFSSFISGTEEDFVSATFVNLNGTRVYVPVSRQEFDDGFVGLYPSGGILEAESDGSSARVLLEPQAIESRAVFKVDFISRNEILQIAGGVEPVHAKLLGKGLNVRKEGSDISLPMGIEFDISPNEIEIYEGMNGPEDGVFAICAITEVAGETAYLFLEGMAYEAGKLVPNSPPDIQLHWRELATAWEANAENMALRTGEGFVLLGTGQTIVEVASHIPDPVGSLMQFAVVAIQMQTSRKVRVVGKVIACDVDSTLPCDPAITPGLGGATVSLLPSSVSLSGLPRGGLNRGAMFALSDSKGRYSLVVDNPSLINFTGTVSDDTGLAIATATHPRFFGQRPARAVHMVATSPSAVADLVFLYSSQAGENTSPPFISASHSPPRPPPGGVAQLRVLATHGEQQPTLEPPKVEEVISLAPNVTVTPEDVEITGPVTNVAGPRSISQEFTVQSDFAVRIILGLEAAAANGKTRKIRYALNIGGQDAVVPGQLNQVDSNDKTPPTVVRTWPFHGAESFPAGHALEVVFSEPVDKAMEEDPSAVQLSPADGVLTWKLSPDQQVLTIQPHRLKPGVEYAVTISPAVKDLAGNPLDQFPETTASDSFSFSFVNSPNVIGAFTGLNQGGGAVTRGIYAYVLDRGRGNQNAIVVFDLSDPAAPVEVNRVGFPGWPRDLALIPRYSYVLRPGEAVHTNDLLAVVGGDITPILDSDANISFQAQAMRVYSLANPENPSVIASRLISIGSITAARKLEWEPPLLAYLESGADSQQIGLVNLQSFIIGANLTQAEFKQLPLDPTDGVDLNGDGDYVDEGESLPLPSRSPFEFAGKVGAIVIEDTTQRIQDFDLNTKVGHLSVTLEAGFEVNVHGATTSTPVEPAYRILLDTGTLLTREQRVPSSFNFPGAWPKRVFNLFGVLLESATNATVANLAFVSVHEGGSSRLVVLDISNALDIQHLTDIEIEAALGLVQSVSLREDGLLRVETSNRVLLLNPSRLLLPVEDPLHHPAIVGMIPGAGSGSFTSDANLAGFNVVGLGGQTRVVQAAPTLVIGSLPERATVLDPEQITDSDDAIQEILNGFASTGTVFPARYREAGTNAASTLNPPQPEVHYHVLVFAPGSAGATIDLALESLNAQGYPLRNKGVSFAPVRAVSGSVQSDLGQSPRPECDAPIRVLPAYRLSDRKGSPFYNYYLSRPFALTYEAMTKTELTDLLGQVSREILWSGFYLRASIDPGMSSNPVLGPFAGSVDGQEKVIRPGAAEIVQSLPGDYVLGPNPPHSRGFYELPGFFGTVSAHNAEFRTQTTDLSLPSRRMPIVLERHIGGQDLYDGPFGRGWDFMYNQRLVELKGGLFPPGSSYPLVLRGGPGDVIAESSDVLVYTGTGQMVLFRNEGTNAPPEVVNDPLMEDLDWLSEASHFFLPGTEGVFDTLVRFPSGEFARLTPEGTQYWYDSLGSLSRIYDRFEKNEIRLSRNARGELIRIDDKSVEVDRFLEFGYYRASGDPLKNSQLDKDAVNPYVIGKICRARDYSGREINYEYDVCGRLEFRKGPNITANGPSGFTGILETKYLYASGTSANGISGIVAGTSSGSSLISSQQDTSVEFAPQVTQGNGAAGAVGVSLGHANTAEALQQGSGSAQASLPDGLQVSVDIGKQGLPESVTYSGGGLPLKRDFEYYDNGLLKKITFPEGNSIELVYDTQNSNLRARGNLTRIVKRPGGRPGDTLTLEIPRDDLKYNVSSGSGTDFNGNQITYSLDGSGKQVGKVQYGGAGSYTYTYNDYGQIESITDLDGFRTEFDYDTQYGFLTLRKRGGLQYTFTYQGIDGLRGFPTTISPPASSPESPVTQTYTERGRVVTSSQPPLTEGFSYDQNGNLIRHSTSLGDGSPLVVTMEYEQNGFLKSRIFHQVETDGSNEDLKFTYTPDNLWRIKEILHPGGEVQRFENYNAHGLPERMTFGPYAEDYTYDGNGNVLSSTGRGGGQTAYSYDGHDRSIETVTPTGEKWTRSFFGTGELKTLKVTDQNGGVNEDSTWTIDEAGRVKTHARTGNQATRNETWNYGGTTVNLTVQGGESYTFNYNSARLIEKITDSIRTVSYTFSGDMVAAINSQEGMSFNFDFTPINALGFSERLTDNLGTVASYTVRHDGAITSSRDALNRTIASPRSRLGEILELNKPLGVDLDFEYSSARKLSSVKDRSNKGTTMTFDDSQLPETVTFRDGASSAFTLQNGAVKDINTPGGTTGFTLDDQGRPTEATISHEGDIRSETYTYDAFSRVTTANYPAGSTTYTIDSLGPVTGVEHQIDGESYPVSYTIRGDGHYTRITYPSGVTLDLNPDAAGRIQHVTTSSGDPVIASRVFVAADLVGTEMLGASRIEKTSDFDGRKRARKVSYRRLSDGALLAESRHIYDAVNNIEGSQYVHRSGRADFFQYDDSDRLKAAHFGARPGSGFLQGVRNVPLLSGTGSGGFRPGFHSRSYLYDGAGLDYLSTISSSNPDGLIIPAFEPNPLPPDSLARDSRGNQKTVEVWLPDPAAIGLGVLSSLQVQYDGRGNLIRATRPDQTQVNYAYNENNLMIKKTLSGPGFPVPQETVFVYEGLRLIEEYVRTGSTNEIKARYYYSDNEIPVAAEFRGVGTNLNRYYFLTDAGGSVMALADEDGLVVERYHYDAFGQPQIERRDAAIPRVKRILSGGGGSLLIEFSERVLPPLTSTGGTDFLTSMEGLEQSLRLAYDDNGTPKTDDGAKVYEENLPGMLFGAVIRFLPQFPIPNSFTVDVTAGQVFDEWGNGNPAEKIAVAYDPTPGTVLYFNDLVAETSPVRTAASSVDSPFLFQGQYYDYDVGLYYLRARHYNPYSGIFLQRDPFGYGDSPNLYAGLGNNAVSNRDPLGLNWFRAALGAVKGTRNTAKAAAEAGRPAGNLKRASGLPASKSVNEVLGDVPKAPARSKGGQFNTPERTLSPSTKELLDLLDDSPAEVVAKGRRGSSDVQGRLPDDGDFTALFGKAQDPTFVRDGEGKLPDDLQIVDPGGNVELKPYVNPRNGKQGQYLWAIDEDGRLRVAREIGPDGKVRKHTDLTGAGHGRIGGEIRPGERIGDLQTWQMDFDSGRYSLQHTAKLRQEAQKMNMSPSELAALYQRIGGGGLEQKSIPYQLSEVTLRFRVNGNEFFYPVSNGLGR